MSQLSEALPSASDCEEKPGGKKKIVLKLADRKKVTSDGSTATRAIKFPQKAKGASAKPFAQTFRVVDLMHEALHDDIPTTKRDIYYKDVPLFKSQGVVDKLVDDLAATFSLGRADLHVRASSKGLVCGAGLTIHMNNSEVIHGTLIPAGEEIAQFDVSDALGWVLIVEKEAVFQTLCRLRLTTHPSLPGPGILITGKGYPDVATRQLVKTLADNLPARVPVLALVDGDAFGLDILSVYRFGSAGMRHERARLAAARVRWLGIWASELAGLGVDRDALIPMTRHDEKKALAMLRRPDLPRRWRKELQCMLHTRRKAEIEVLSTIGSAAGAAHDAGEDDAVLRPKRVAPMLHYLAEKVSAVVADYARKAG
ncbi:DNA topoisomerase IV alpha subunit [Amylocystis lapponica]|nr:DNA topoisomerase IV alpha subunit [Amylocystis lapponica]